MSEKTYNGWTNYETWNVKLWMDNDQGSYEYWQEEARRYGRKDDVYGLSKALQSHHDDIVQDALERANLDCSFMADLVGAAMSEVNWYEIAQSLIDDHCDKDEEEETEEETA